MNPWDAQIPQVPKILLTFLPKGTLNVTVMIYCLLDQACLPQESTKAFFLLFSLSRAEDREEHRQEGVH